MAEPKDHVVYEITSGQRCFRARLLSGSDELCKLMLEEIEVKEVVGEGSVFRDTRVKRGADRPAQSCRGNPC